MPARQEDDKTWNLSEGENPARERAYGDTTGMVSAANSPTRIAQQDETIGPYRLLAPLGEGGMGTVYRAEQTEPVKRQVALKVIRSGMDSAKVVARFEAERQALALMDHPNIARVFDAGTTTAGRPYFVMELVLGVPLTQFADEARLTVAERLELFMPICQAVQHAHQKGVIHRDLKPSNILVAEYDGRPVPKVIDFGVAKATVQKLTERTLATEIGQVIGTLQYMSPEQADLSQLDVDTRSDIYSLGVVLYEMLTGTPPLGFSDLKDATFVDLLQKIHDDEPLRPSLRIGKIDEPAKVAAQRKTEPARLARELSGDLDWIVMKALAKERSRRYETASALALDLGRYLAGEPVEAGPPSAVYRLRKFVRRNRGAVAAATTILTLLIVGAIVSAVLAVRATTAERLARASEATARAEEQRAKQAAEEALAVLSFFQNHVLAAARPEDQQGGLGIDATIRAAVDAAEPRIAAAFAGQPLAEASIRDSLGSTYLYLGEANLAIGQYEQSTKLREKHLPAGDTATLTSQSNLASAYRSAGRLDAAVLLYEKTLARMKERLDPDDPEVLTCQGNLALAYQDAARFDDALALFKQTLEQRTAKQGRDHAATLGSLNNLALAYQASGRSDLAIPWFDQALEKMKNTLGADHPDTLTTLNNLAMAQKGAGNLDVALPLLEQAYQKRSARLGDNHPSTLASLNNLAIAMQESGRRDEALPLLEQIWEKRRARLSANHPDLLISQNNLALAYQSAGKVDKAVPLFEQAYEARRAKYGADHPDTLTAESNLALAYVAANKADQGVPLLEASLARRLAKLGANHIETINAQVDLAIAYQGAGKRAEALPLLERVWEFRKGELGPDAASTLAAQNNVAAAYKQAGRTADAAKLFQDAVEVARGKLSFAHGNTQTFLRNLLFCYEELKQPDLAEPYLRELAELTKEKDGADSPQYARQLAQLGTNLLEQKKYVPAEPVLRACLAIREKVRPDEWQTYNTRSMLGGSLAGQKKYAAAEPLLVQGYEGIAARADKLTDASRQRLTESLERLVQFYEAWDKPEQAAMWKAKLEAAKPNSSCQCTP